MQISVERIDDLNRKLTVQVPESTIRERVENRLRSLAREAKFDGFRPGKVPSSLVRKRFGRKVREEVLSDLIESTFARAVRDENLHPAGSPQITAKGGVEGEGFVYEAAFEVFPEFVLMPLETLDVKRYTSSVTEQDVDMMIERLREQRRTWREVQRAAEPNDRLVIAFDGTVGGERMGEGRVENFPYVLGGHQLFEGFGDHLQGAHAGSHHAFDLPFPEDYYVTQWAGKTAHFEVDVSRVEEPVIPDLDAEFVKSFGIEDGDLAAWRLDVRQNMEREMTRALKSRTKSALMDVLLQQNKLNLPVSLVERELKDLLAPHLASEKTSDGASEEEAGLRERYEGVARRRVALGLILNKLVELNQIKVDPKKVRAAVEDLATSYEQPEQVVHWYYSNEKHLREVENLVLEDQVVDWILEKAKVIEEAVPFRDLVQPSTQPA